MSKRRKDKVKVSAMDDDEEVKASKEECQVAKFLLSHLPEKEGKLHGMPVKIFIGEEAVEALLSDSYRRSKIAKTVPIADISSAVNWLRTLMAKQMFHRAERVLKKRREKDDALEKSAPGLRKRRKDDEKNNSKAIKEECGDEVQTTEEGDNKDLKGKKKEKDKKKRKIKLTMHEEQNFINADEVYVWIYDPVRLKNVIGGIAMVVVTIVCCLFPLWPNVLKSGAYYISIGGLGVVGLLIGIGLLRCLLFVLVWGCSVGKCHFWLFPNFSEDCGVLESFQPLYSCDTRSSGKESSEKAIKATTEENEITKSD